MERRGRVGPWQPTPTIPVGDELDALLGQPEIRQRLEESPRRFQAGERRNIPHEWSDVARAQ
jgi:hypothetical protein